MKKIALILIPLFLVVVIYLFLTSGLHASRDNLYKIFNIYPEIKVYLGGVIDETGHPDVKVDLFRNVFKDVLRKRVNIEFIPVETESEADVIINCRIRDYVFQKKAPPYRPGPLFISAIAVVADTAEPKSAAKLVVDYEVRRPEDDKVIYSYKKLTTEERQPQALMEGEMGYIAGLKENMNRFIFRAFYKRGSER